MSSPTDRIYDSDDPSPYAPRWVRHAPNGQQRIPARGQIGREIDGTNAGEEADDVIIRSEHAPPLAAAAPVVHDDELLINDFRVPRSLDPGIVPDPRPARRSRLGRPRVFGMLGRLALAGSAAAVVALVAVSKLSLPGMTGATEQADNLIAFGSRFAGHAAKPQDQPSLAERAGEPRQQVALAQPGAPAMPAITSASVPAPAPPAPAANIVAPAPPKPTPTATTLDPDSEEVATLVKRGQELAAAGDLAAARLVLRRAAEAHNARAALALGATYDPIVLETLGIYGVVPDITAARSWYEKAKEYGSAEAPRRLEMLVSRQR